MLRLIIAVLLISGSNVFAASVATVLFTLNDVVSGNSQKLHRGSTLNVGDSITTSATAQARLKYNNGTLVNLGPGSNYKILAYSPSGSIEIKAALLKGKLYSKTTGQKKEILNTPAISLAINGTEYNVYVKGPTVTNVSVTQGLVQAGTVQIGPGQSVVATPSGVQAAAFPAEGSSGTSSNPPTTNSDGTSSSGGSSSSSSTSTSDGTTNSDGTSNSSVTTNSDGTSSSSATTSTTPPSSLSAPPTTALTTTIINSVETSNPTTTVQSGIGPTIADIAVISVTPG